MSALAPSPRRPRTAPRARRVFAPVAAALALSAAALGCAGAAPATPAPARAGAALLAPTRLPPLPARPLLSQDGEEVALAPLLERHVVVLVFGYVRCTGTCPLTTANLRRVQDLLPGRLGRDVLLVTITLDPEHDTPAVLKRHAEERGAGPGWLFLTGEPADVDAIRAALGFVGGEAGAGADRSDHAALALVGSASLGRWMHLPALGSPRDLASAALRLADAAAGRVSRGDRRPGG